MKKGMAMEELGWWILAIVLFVLLVVGVIYLKVSGTGALEFIKKLFRFG